MHWTSYSRNVYGAFCSHQTCWLFRLCQDYLSTAVGWLSSPVDQVRNVNGTHKVLYFIRGRYRAARHRWAKDARRGAGVCYICLKGIDAPLPLLPKAKLKPCCSKPIHLNWTLKHPTCRGCKVSLKVLPCGFCNFKIADEVDCYLEYEESLRNRLPCCGSDAHESCRNAADHHRCPVCQCHWRTGRLIRS